MHFLHQHVVPNYGHLETDWDMLFEPKFYSGDSNIWMAADVVDMNGTVQQKCKQEQKLSITTFRIKYGKGRDEDTGN